MTGGWFAMVSHGSNSTDSDAVLIARVRRGDRAAFGELWGRHEDAARRLARQLAKPGNVDDLVSEAFARLLAALVAGGGPDGAFRPYLLTTVRNLHSDQNRSNRRQVPLGPDEDRDPLGLPAPSADETALEHADELAAWRAWQSLPPAQRTVLWHMVVEEESPTTVARLLGTSANGVSSRTTRARERLRQAFLQQHVAAAPDERCAGVRSRLGAYVRGALSNRDQRATDRHLARCPGCRASLAEIRDVNQTLRALIVPLVLGGGAVVPGYLTGGAVAVSGAVAGTATSSAASGGASGAGSAGGWFASLPHPALLLTGATAVAATAVALTLVVGTGSPSEHEERRSPAPVPSTSSPHPAPAPLAPTRVLRPAYPPVAPDAG